MLRRLAGPYFAGALAAAVVELGLWVAARAGLGAFLDVQLAKLVPGELAFGWLARRLLEGSLFALLLPLARWRGLSPVRAGLAISLLPTALALFVRLPAAGLGMLGVQAGALTPVVVLGVNAVWGWLAGRLVGSTGEAAH